MRVLTEAAKKLEAAFKFREALELLAGLPDEHKEAIKRVVSTGEGLKGDELKAYQSDIQTGLDPEKYIHDEFAVENESIRLTQMLTRETTRARQLSFFTDAYLEKLKDRAARAQLYAEKVREDRKRREEEEKKANGAIPFPQAN